MNEVYTFLSTWLEPLTSPLHLGPLLLLLFFVSGRGGPAWRAPATVVLFTALFWVAYRALLQHPDAAIWLRRLDNPFFAVLTVIALPAIFLPRNRWYPLFLLFPAACFALAVLEVTHQYKAVPGDAEFAWILIRPGFLIAGVVGLLVTVQYFLSLDHFRKVTRISMLLLLIYGGFVFRQDYADYSAMIERRQEHAEKVLNLSETWPVMRYDEKLSYIPGAPCRFSADGGYVQGCVMELFQRILQVDFSRVGALDPVETSRMAIALAALLSILMFFYISGRWFCGWVCPLSTLGDLFDVIRAWLGLPHLKPVPSVKRTFFYSGLSFGVFTLGLAKLFPFIDETGRFMGCKIPLYPFCKICPGQQVCPVASRGIDAYPPLPDMEWLFGFFRVSALLLLGIYLAAFIFSRRLWCRFCPMGMVGGIFNRGGLLSLKKDAKKCNGCGVCNEVCPMDVRVVQKEMEKEDVSSFDCVYCLRCVDNCPRDKCLRLEFAGKKITESDIMKRG